MPPHPSLTRRLLTIAWAASAIAIASPAAAQSAQPTQAGAPVGRKGVRLGAPPGAYIAERLKDADLDDRRAVTREHEGGKITFTPAKVTDNLDDAAQGYVLGVLETEVAGGETGLPPGRYTIFAKSVGGEWEAFAEVDGVIAKQALQVIADEAPEDGDGAGKPQFATSEGGWCWITGPYPAPSTWGRYDSRGYWHYYPIAWGRHQKLTVCW